MNISTNQPVATGLWLPLITPFSNGRVDENAVVTLVHHYIERGINGLIIGATTGESLALDDGELHRIVTLAQAANKGRVPLYLGRGGSWTDKMVASLRVTNEWPIDGYLITSPYFVRPSQKGLIQHFTALAEASRPPIIMYNIPYRTGVNMSNETILELAQHDRIIGIKDCCAIREQSLDLFTRKDPGFSVLVGDDAHFFDYVQAGANGGILASAHIAPELYGRVFAALRTGAGPSVEQEWRAFQALIPLLFQEPNPGPIKAILQARGLIADDAVRLPLTPVTPELRAKLAVALP